MARGHQLTEPRLQNHASLPKDDKPAEGQVLVIPFEVDLYEFTNRHKPSLDDLTTVVIIKPHWDTPYFKFIGGMLKSPGAFEQAAYDEPREEAGVIINPKQLWEAFETTKRLHPPHQGTFPLRLYLAFGCDFRSVFETHWGETGDEGEVAMRVRFGDINQENTWPIPTKPEERAGFFPPYLDLLDAAKRKFNG